MSYIPLGERSPHELKQTYLSKELVALPCCLSSIGLELTIVKSHFNHVTA
jgi:hypothetical protein